MKTLANGIDIVIPHVNCNDKQWITSYCKATKCYSFAKERFRSWDTFKYWFRGVEKYCPFVRNVVLILASESQIPSWLNTDNVRIVYHRDFIPSKFLPLFNSSAIESFLYNISDLSDRFIYFNDDMFLVDSVSIEDFFLDNKPKVKFNFHDSYNKHSIFRKSCRNSLDMITDALKIDRYPEGKLFLSNHSVAPLLSSTLSEVKELCETKIPSTITATRSPNNVHKHIYEYYQYFKGTCTEEDYSLRFKYFEMSDNLTAISEAILHSDLQLVCLNDSDKIKDYKKTRDTLISIFEERLPEKCRFEN